MIKKLFIAVLALTFLLATAAVALAGTGRWLNDTKNYKSVANMDAAGKHNGVYGTATNKCSNCHAVHNAGSDYAGTGAYKLLRTQDDTATVGGACNFCHNSGMAGVPQPFAAFAGSGATTRAIHRIDGSATSIPDVMSSGQDVAKLGGSSLSCFSCHNAAPHGGGAEYSPVWKLFRESTAATAAGDGAAYGVSRICIRCHDGNNLMDNAVANQWDKRSHPMVLSADGNARTGRNSPVVGDGTSSARCVNCHANTGANATSVFPHSSDAARFLTTAAGDLNAAGTGGALDAVCVGCHRWSSDNSGVGKTF